METEFEICATIAKSGLFDSDWYLEQNPDVKAAGIDPLLHYIRNGEKEMRNPSADIDLKDLLQEFGNTHNLLLRYITGNKPAEQKGDVHVAFCADAKYLPYLGVALTSLVETANPEIQYIVHIIHDGSPLKRLHKLQMSGHENIKIELINLSAYNKLLPEKLHVSEHVSRATYNRLLLPVILSDIPKILYLDCDILIKEDIGTLFDMDIENHIFGAIPEIFGEDDFSRLLLASLPLETIPYYCNAGVLLLNLQECRKSGFSQICLEMAASGAKYVCWDQDILNIAANGRIKKLPTKWNVFWHLYSDSKFRYLDAIQFRRYLLDFANPAIVHFTSGQKPWNYDDGHFSRQFWQMAAKSPLFEEIAGNCPYEEEALAEANQ